ncbi:6-phosphogluconolactonase [Striga asiatica]|uniref:6-phosphogluconolactonase n=1 Tax=Striga asiatica TaxID=4170 RepID=A0A5A7RIT3_STRAF|nr:6-phosphogluconolactonase [Striga asiatica]
MPSAETPRRIVINTDKVPIPIDNVHAIDDTLSAEAAAEDYETRLDHLVKTKTLDQSQNALVVAGAGKASAVYTALSDVSNCEVLPVGLVEPEGELTWFLDKEAASKL